MADTYGAGMPGAARCTMVKARSVARFLTRAFLNSVAPQLAQALRRSKNRAPQLVHSWARR